jgi:uncharacterized protein YndB with AHSA1/START domain
MTSAKLRLEVRRVIDASAARLFEAWTTPRLLERWWGPAGVRCTGAELDLRVGGSYRIVNLLPDGRELVIAGEFLEVEPCEKLVYTWSSAPGSSELEQVTVRFEARGRQTEVVIVHERAADEAARQGHAAGWNGCLDGLDAFVARARPDEAG